MSEKSTTQSPSDADQHADNTSGKTTAKSAEVFEPKENIYLFIPNLIGYARIVLALIAFFYMRSNYVVAGWCYIVSALLDSVDGHAARAFDQSTRFGAMLDQLTDRCGTMGLMVTLSHFYPQYMFLFQCSMAIDVAGHWIYMQACALQGKTSHKFLDVNENFILRQYYKKDILTFMCCGNELFYCALYLLNFTVGPTLFGFSLLKLIAALSLPVAVAKAAMSLMHMGVAAQNFYIMDNHEREVLRREKAEKEAKLAKKAE